MGVVSDARVLASWRAVAAFQDPPQFVSKDLKSFRPRQAIGEKKKRKAAVA